VRSRFWARERRPVVLAIFFGACAQILAPAFPSTATPFVAPVQYRVWWRVIESCAERSGSFERVSWYSVRHSSDLRVEGEHLIGAWFPSGNRIVLADSLRGYGPLVRHEMLHAILGDDGHPTAFFDVRCGDAVTCGRTCGAAFSDQHVAGATRLDPSDLIIDAGIIPDPPSLSQYDGWVVIGVSVTNPAPVAAVVALAHAAGLSCQWGYRLLSVTTSTRGIVDCAELQDSVLSLRPHETRRVFFDLNLVHPPLSEPFQAESVVLSAQFVDAVRESGTLVIKP